MKRLKNGRTAPSWVNGVKRQKTVDVFNLWSDLKELAERYKLLAMVHKALRKKYIVVQGQLIQVESNQPQEPDEVVGAFEDYGWVDEAESIDDVEEYVDEDAMEIVNRFQFFLEV